jgi:hypothetical protein
MTSDTATCTRRNGRSACETNDRPRWIYNVYIDDVREFYGIKPRLVRTSARSLRQILTISRAVTLSADVPG